VEQGGSVVEGAGRFSFDGRVVIVTGAGAGLGRSYALGLAQRGARVVVNDIGGDVRGGGSSRSAADEVVELIRQSGGTAVPSYDSIATLEGGTAVIDTALNEFGTVDVVINNAGILRPAPIPDVSRDEFEGTVAVHLLGSFYVSQAAFRVMAANSYGRLVFTTSSAAMFGIETEVAYAAAKASVIGLVNVFAIEGAKVGVRANAVMPNAITRMADALTPEAAAGIAGTTSLEPGARPPFELSFHEQPHDVEAMVTYLASAECAVTQNVYSVLGNRFARVFSGVTPGWHAPAGSVPTPEDIAAHVGEIENEDGYGVPRHLGEEIKHAQGIRLAP
jgi:NAD(P)-dependent dehydrogenase (short-subunit alcohol dehydrogenase family)